MRNGAKETIAVSCSDMHIQIRPRQLLNHHLHFRLEQFCIKYDLLLLSYDRDIDFTLRLPRVFPTP